MLSVAYALPASAQIEMVDLGTLAGFANWRFSAATDINDAGQIVGISDTISGYQHAFFWQNAVMTDLGKTDGCANSGAPDNNDWIKDCASQNIIYPYVLNAIARVEALLN